MKKNIYFFEVKDKEKMFVIDKYPNANITEESCDIDLAEKYKDAHIVCGMVHSDFSREVLEKFINLELIVARSVGYNNIDLKYCDENNISVCHVPEYGSHVIAEHVFALLLASVRKIIQGEEKTQSGNFEDDDLCGTALMGKTIGIIGTGKIGSHVCRIASRGFLMDVIACDLHPDQELANKHGFKYVDNLEELYKKSDFITIHVPLFPETKHMINSETIAQMKDGATLINTSRGALINTCDLVDAIKSGKFAHVALDVVEHENNLKEVSELLHLPNVIITPHIAYYTHESIANMYQDSLNSISEFLEGKELKHRVIGY